MALLTEGALSSEQAEMSSERGEHRTRDLL